MRFRMVLMGAFLLAMTLRPLLTSGCGACAEEPACQFADLLAACASTVGCALTRAAKLEPGSDLQNPPVQTMASWFAAPTSVALPPNSSVTVPVVEAAATLTTLPLLDINVGFASGEADQVSVFVDRQSWSACVPSIATAEGGPSSEEWKCPLAPLRCRVSLRATLCRRVAASLSLQP